MTVEKFHSAGNSLGDMSASFHYFSFPLGGKHTLHAHRGLWAFLCLYAPRRCPRGRLAPARQDATARHDLSLGRQLQVPGDVPGRWGGRSGRSCESEARRSAIRLLLAALHPPLAASLAPLLGGEASPLLGQKVAASRAARLQGQVGRRARTRLCPALAPSLAEPPRASPPPQKVPTRPRLRRGRALHVWAPAGCGEAAEERARRPGEAPRTAPPPPPPAGHFCGCFPRPPERAERRPRCRRRAGGERGEAARHGASALSSAPSSWKRQAGKMLPAERRTAPPPRGD
uniref:uncharacterized protein LOC114602978 n=1 Tax=Podarcis muralis TaxID=64176 RepID=UPI00109FCFBA|nr:uncharacterized protein LOC114602978 [Podarcis muralis]